MVFTAADIAALVTSAKSDWTPSSGLGVIQYYFNPSSLQAGMSVSVTPASGTATYVCACFPNSLTASANAAWPSVQYWTGNGSAGTGALNGTIVSSTWNGTTGTLVVQPASART